MNWPYLKRNIAGIVLLIVTVGGLLFFWVINPDLLLFWVINPDLLRKDYGSGPGANRGFGPEWDCLSQAPFCIKRAMRPDKSN
jgi:hypothetical protein